MFYFLWKEKVTSWSKVYPPVDLLNLFSQPAGNSSSDILSLNYLKSKQFVLTLFQFLLMNKLLLRTITMKLIRHVFIAEAPFQTAPSSRLPAILRCNCNRIAVEIRAPQLFFDAQHYFACSVGN